MKKILALVLALCMVFALAACGQAAAPAAQEVAPAQEAAPAAEEAAPAEEAAAPAVKVGLIFLHDENSTYDANFLNAAKEVFEANGMVEGTDFIIKTQIPEDQTCEDTALDLVDQGCNVIFSDSYGHQSYMLAAAKECPDVDFISATGDMATAEKLANYHNAFADIYMGRFLVGVAAGLKLNEMIESGKITADQAKMGYVGN
jgi:basic membrane protein A